MGPCMVVAVRESVDMAEAGEGIGGARIVIEEEEEE